MIWLEDLSGERHERWDTADYGRAAKDLGRFSAHHAGRPLASHRWLHRGCLRSLASIRGAGTLDLLARPETWQHPRVRRYFAESHLHRLVRVWQERDLYLNALDRLPQTLCHFDISRHNLFLLDGSNGRRQTVAIDWASAGIGALGEDLSLLVPPPFFRLEEDVTWLPQQAEMVFDGYMYGLVEDGWRGPEHLVRLGYTIAVALRTVFIAPTLLAMLDAQARAYEERRWGASLEQLMAWRAPLTYWLLDRIDEARGLLPIR
ncbi:MAG: phosphotransferase [Dehalococcoidia bacterium]